MNPLYYTLPLCLDSILQKQELQRCNLKQSVYNHIHLILTTAFGEMSNDPNYGCSIWESDFDNLTSNNKIREQIKQSLLRAVNLYENRIKNVKVDVLIKQEEQQTKLAGKQIKKLLDINIIALLVATNEQIQYNDRFFTGPFSYD